MEDELDRQQIKDHLTSLEEDLEFVAKFNYLMGLMYEIAKDRGWHNPSKSFPEEILMMHCELSEAIEEYRTEFGAIEDVYYKDNKPEGVGIELADLEIRLFDTVVHRNIDLLRHIFTKAHFNLDRPNRHGEKKI